MRIRHRDRSEEFWPAYTDILMVTALILIFVVLALIIVNTRYFAQAEIKRRQNEIQQAFEKVMPSELAAKRMHIEAKGEQQDITFSDSLLFDKGSDRLKPEGVATMKKVAKVLGAHSRDTYAEIQVKGHTDIDPIRTSSFRSNWHLSSSRATSVVEFLTANGINPDTTVLSASGYSQHQEVDAGKTETAKAKNRRIEITLRYPLSSIEEYFKRMVKK